MIKYYIYEIPGIKIGVTNNLSRRKREIGKKGNLKVLETHTDIFKASERERELQKDKGYKFDKQPYWYVTLVKHPKTQTKEAIKKKVANTDYKAIAKKVDHKARVAKIDWYASRKPLFKAVKAISPEGNIFTFESIREASEQLTEKTGIVFSRQGIGQTCSPKRRLTTYRGYKFHFIENDRQREKSVC